MKKTLTALTSLVLALLLALPLGAVASAASLGKVKSVQTYAIDDDEINLKWKKVSGAYGYGVYMHDGEKWRGIGSTKKTSYEADDLKSAKVYKFRIRAYKLVNSKRVYGPYCTTVVAATEPDEVENVKVSKKTKNSVTLKWSKVSNARGYQVYQYDSAKEKYVRKAVVSGTSATVKNLKAGTSYKFKVRAYYKPDSKYRYGDFSDVLSVKTSASSKAASSSSSSSKSNYIGTSKAGEIALNHAGYKKSQVRQYECKLDKDNGVYVYDVEFEYGRYDFEYEINAKTGKILRWERDAD